MPAINCAVTRLRELNSTGPGSLSYWTGSLMLVAALSPVIGYHKASKIAHLANGEGLTLKEAALQSGDIDEKYVDPRKMVGHGVGGKLKARWRWCRRRRMTIRAQSKRC